MSLSSLVCFITAHLKDFLDGLAGIEVVYTVGHSYVQCKHTHTFTQPVTVGKWLEIERVDSDSVCYSPDIFLPGMCTTCVRLAFQRVHLELRKGERRGGACGKKPV